MKNDNALRMVDYLEDEGFEASIYEGYSGRGMYGKETDGVTTSATPVEMARMENDMSDCDINPNVRTDNMGLDYIYY